MIERAPRQPLSRDRILRAAVIVADREGLGALTMRRLGAELGVEAMSLYKHIANKEAILDGIVELIAGQIGIPAEVANWRDALRRRAVSARAVYAGHSWAVGLLEARGSMGPASMRSLDSMLGTLRAGGFAIEDAAHAIWLLDSYVYGHIIQESSIASRETQSDGPDLGGEYPHLAALLDSASRSHFSLDGEFEYGLERILDALQP